MPHALVSLQSDDYEGALEMHYAIQDLRHYKRDREPCSKRQGEEYQRKSAEGGWMRVSQRVPCCIMKGHLERRLMLCVSLPLQTLSRHCGPLLRSVCCTARRAPMLCQLTMLWLHQPAQACCFWLPLGSRWVPLLCSGTAPFCSLLVPSFCNQSASCVSSVRLVYKPLFLSLRGSDKLRESRLYHANTHQTVVFSNHPNTMSCVPKLALAGIQ